ncbi:MAG: aldolase/citrate lyase family protein [Caldilineaceae bacterium]
MWKTPSHSAAKAAAHTTVVGTLERLDFAGRERLVRVNPVNSALCRRDLEAVVPARPDGVVVAKVESPDDLTSWPTCGGRGSTAGRGRHAAAGHDRDGARRDQCGGHRRGIAAHGAR